MSVRQSTKKVEDKPSPGLPHCMIRRGFDRSLPIRKHVLQRCLWLRCWCRLRTWCCGPHSFPAKAKSPPQHCTQHDVATRLAVRVQTLTLRVLKLDLRRQDRDKHYRVHPRITPSFFRQIFWAKGFRHYSSQRMKTCQANNLLHQSQHIHHTLTPYARCPQILLGETLKNNYKFSRPKHFVSILFCGR